jgi:hypothetical protein
MLLASLAFLIVAFAAGSLCLADLPVTAASVARELSASSLAFSAILAIAYRAFFARVARNSGG